MHNVKDHQVLFVAGPSTRPTNSRWRAVGIFTKTVKSRNFLNHLADFGEIWRGNTMASWSRQNVKISNFWNPRWRRLPYWNKKEKSRNLTNYLTNSHQNLVRWCRKGLLTGLAVRNLQFSESKMSAGWQVESTELNIPCWRKLSRGVSCRRRWPPPTALALTTLLGY